MAILFTFRVFGRRPVRESRLKKYFFEFHFVRDVGYKATRLRQLDVPIASVELSIMCSTVPNFENSKGIQAIFLGCARLKWMQKRIDCLFPLNRKAMQIEDHWMNTSKYGDMLICSTAYFYGMTLFFFSLNFLLFFQFFIFDDCLDCLVGWLCMSALWIFFLSFCFFVDTIRCVVVFVSFT